MFPAVADLLGAQPILTLFLAVGLGYAVGQITILGFSLGIGAVLFVGLFLGAVAPKAQIAGPIGLVGLTMFLYGIGIFYGRQFFEGLSGPGRKYNLLALLAVARRPPGDACARPCLPLEVGHTLGLFAGSMTNTPSLQAAMEVTGNNDPSVGYSVAYPFGVIGPILCFYLMTRRVRPTLPAEARAVSHGGGHDRRPARGRRVIAWRPDRVAAGRHADHRGAAGPAQSSA